MKRLISWVVIAAAAVIVGALGFCADSNAQQPPEDGRLAVYRQLLTRANDELTAMGAQLQAAQIENAQLKAQIAKLNPDAAKGPIQSDGKPMPPPMPLDKKP